MVAKTRSILAENLRRRGISRVVFFHCDHFEPWQSFDGRGHLDPRHVDDLLGFLPMSPAEEAVCRDGMR